MPREKQQKQENDRRYKDGKAISHHCTILEGLWLDNGKSHAGDVEDEEI